MKKYFFPSLLCVALFFFTFISCSQNPNVCSDVTITFPVREVYNILAARSGDTDTSAQESVENYEHTGILTIDLYVNDTLTSANSKSQIITYGAVKKEENIPFVFADIEIGSKVQAKASVTVDDLIVCKGESESKVLQNDVLELELVLELVNKDSGTDNSSTGEGTSSGGGNTSGEGTSSGGGNTSGEGTTGSDVEINCNIYLRYYAKESLNSTEDYTLLESFGGQTTYTFAQIDDNPYLINTNDDLYSQSIWFEFTKNIGGYVYASEVENSDEESVGVTIDDAGIIYVDYYLIKEKPVSECKSISGVSDQNNYTLKLYSIGDYEICNSSGDSILIGMWSTTEVSGRVGFSEFMYQKDGKKALSPNFYKDGELVMDGSDPRFDLKTDVVNFNAASGTFTLKYYDDEHDDEDSAIPITFTIPQNFDIAAFEESRYGGNGNTDIDSGNYNGGGQISITPTSGLVHISATPSDFYLNTGSVNLKAVTRQEGADVTSSVTWSAKLLYGGVDINDYDAYYSLDTATNSVKLVKNLDAAGTYQLYVTASYNGYTSSQTVDVVVNDGNWFAFDVNSNDFTTTFGYYDTTELKGYPGTSLQGLPDKSKIKLSGTLDNDSFRDVMGILYEISADNLELDMWDITGVTQFPMGTKTNGNPKLYPLYGSCVTSVILPQSFTTIVDGSFANDSNTNYYLTSITIPATLTAIEDGGFYNCPKLTEIKLKGSAAAGQNTTYRIDEDGYFYEDKIVNSITETTLLYIPEDKKPDLVSLNLSQVYPGVTGFGAGLFKNITTLESVDLSGIISIGKYAFYGCRKLETISNYDGLQYIGKNAFSNCKGGQFNEITLNSPEITIGVSGISAETLNINFDITQENYDKVRDNVFAGLGSVKNIVLNGETILPDLLESELVGDNIDNNSNTHPKALFYKINSSLKTITFNNTENFKIGDYQFAKFKALTKVITNGGKINEVGNYAFYSKTEQPNVLSSIDLSECTRIGDFAFYECRYLKDTKDDNDPTDFALDLSNVQYIGDQAFVNGTWKANDSYNTYHNVISTINLNKVEYIGYRAFFGWTELTTINNLAKDTTNGCVIADEAFAYHNRGSGGTNNNLIMKISSIDLSYVRVIGCSAFRNCSFTSVTIPERVIALGNCVFYPNALKTAPTVSFGALSEGKIGEWYSLTAKSNNTEDINARDSLWSEIITQTVITSDDISAYRNTLSNDCVSQVSNTSTIGQDLGSTTTTKPYYIRVITSN